MNSLTLHSPAKLNIYLKVLNKRPDGFHNIITIFERISLHDDICIKPILGKKIRILCDHPQVPQGPKNLAFKAVRILQDDLGINLGVSIHIKKRIPVAAGLGGGSSNAATVLMGLNKIWNLGLDHKKLVSYASKLGSDVPFFMHKCSWALGKQRGDSIKILDIRNKLWHIMVVPRICMYSSQVYGRVKMSLTKNGDNDNILIRNLKKNSVLEAGRLLANDLEPVVIKIRPSLGNLKSKLKLLGAEGVMVSGSGPSVFGLVESRKKAQNIKSQLDKRYSQVFIVRTL